MDINQHLKPSMQVLLLTVFLISGVAFSLLVAYVYIRYVL